MLGYPGALAACAVALVVAVPVAAQESINHASVSGRVSDSQGAVVPGATVTARQVETDVSSSVVSDAGGRFRFAYLRVGTYDLSVQLAGFAEARRRIAVSVGAAFEIPIVLAVEGVAATVTVAAEAPVLESARSQIATTVSAAEVQALPLNGRNFLDIALLAPGVAPPNINSTQLFAETSAVQGVGLSVGSQRNLSNSFIVDGLSANDDAAGLSGLPYGVDAIEQFQVVSSGGQAELGRALGGYVNVVTRSGTNQVRGTAYGFFRDDALNAPNALSGTTLPMSQQQYGVSVGGPIRRGRTFYFANAEQRRLDQSGFATISVSSVATVNARLAAVGYPGQTITSGIYDTPIDSLNLLGKIDHAFTGRDQLSVRYSLYDVVSENSRGAGGLSAPSASAGIDNRDQAVSVSNTLTLGARTVNETRAQYTHSDLLALPTDPVGPAVNIAGAAAFGTFPSSPQGRLNRMFQLVNTLAQQRGPHALRAGVDLVYNDDTITFPRAVRGSYAFASLANFLAGTYNNAGFTQTFGDTVVQQGSTGLGLYVQDEWSATPRLTLNLGLRYDLQMLETIDTDTNNLSPRAGFAWTPFDSRDLVVRGSAGLYFDRVPLRALANALLSADNTTDLTNLRQRNISLTPGQAGAPVFPAVLPAPVPSVTLFSLTTMQRDLQNAYSRQASLEIERQIGRFGTASAGYSYLRGRNLLMSINQNVPSCVAAGTNNGCRPIADYANNSQYRSAGESAYHALLVSFARRPGVWGYYRASYTLSQAENNVGEFFFSGPIDPFDLSKDWSRADNDRRHTLVVSAGINSPMTPAATLWQHLTHGFHVSTMLQVYSAAPFNITSGTTTVQGTAGRPIVNGEFIPRNSGVGDEFFSVSVRASRSLRVADTVTIEAVAEVFNLTNAVNELARNAVFGSGTYPTTPSPTYNRVTAVGDPRAWQLALRLRF
ncbi:MAG: TonB-dependent receptor [Acidobacteria bacterium]|nr:TonB-dependent receptor [Acidobacteriota bacterium]